MKILTVVGARPQFVKASVVSRIVADSSYLQETIVHTGQHFSASMSAVFFAELGIPEPKYHLGIDSLSHGAMTGRMLEAVEAATIEERPDLVLVYGDTNSTLAGALAAKKLHVKLAHVEAGLRSFDMRMPEEVNRILTDRISDLLFCPTTVAVENLRDEGFDNFPCEVLQTGDVMFDSVLYFQDRARLSTKTAGQLPQGRGFALCTIHRAENTDDPERLKAIFDALERVHRDLPVIVLLHPRTRKRLDELRIRSNVVLLEPVGYLEMIALLGRCRIVLTDSGGLQKEAFFMRKMCVTLRDATEWTELLDHGVNRLAGSDPETIERIVSESLTAEPDFDVQLYGKGNAGENIVGEILARLDN